MSRNRTEPGALQIRASDAERDQAAEVPRAAFAEGRLARAELDERLAAAYAAKTRADLRDLTVDLPGAFPAGATASGRPPGTDLLLVDRGPGAGVHRNVCLLLCLLCACPPAGIGYGIYWIVTARCQPQPGSRQPAPPPGAGATR